MPQIEVTFDIDENGILNVAAKDKGTGKQTGITITASTKMSESEIDSKIREAENYAEEDKKIKELISLKNQAESLIYQTEKIMKEHADKIGDLKTTIEQKVLALKGAYEGEDPSRIKNSMEDLQTALHQVSERIYGQNQTNQGYPGGAPEGTGDRLGGSSGIPQDDRPEYEKQAEQYRKASGQDNVVDADYEET